MLFILIIFVLQNKRNMNRNNILGEISNLLSTVSYPKRIEIPLSRYNEFVLASNAECGCNRKRVQWFNGIEVFCVTDDSRSQITVITQTGDALTLR